MNLGHEARSKSLREAFGQETNFTEALCETLKPGLEAALGLKLEEGEHQVALAHDDCLGRLDNRFQSARGPIWIESQLDVSDDLHLAQIRARAFGCRRSGERLAVLVWIAEGFRKSHAQAVDALQREHPTVDIVLLAAWIPENGLVRLAPAGDEFLQEDPLYCDFEQALLPDLIEVAARSGHRLDPSPEAVPAGRRKRSRDSIHIAVPDYPTASLAFFRDEGRPSVGLYFNVTRETKAVLAELHRCFAGDPKIVFRRPGRQGGPAPATVSVWRNRLLTKPSPDTPLVNESLKRFLLDSALAILDQARGVENPRPWPTDAVRPSGTSLGIGPFTAI